METITAKEWKALKKKGKRKSKYNAAKTVYNGRKYDSKKEARFAEHLWLREKAGELKVLEYQPQFELQPSFKAGGKHVRAINYRADFKVEYPDGRTEIIDVKGSEKSTTSVYKMKRKMLLFKYPTIIFVEIYGSKFLRTVWKGNDVCEIV